MRDETCLEQARRIWRLLRDLGMAPLLNEYHQNGIWWAEFKLEIPLAGHWVDFNFRDFRFWSTGWNLGKPAAHLETVADYLNDFFWQIRREPVVAGFRMRAWLRVDDGDQSFLTQLSACVELLDDLGQHGAIYRDPVAVQLCIDAMSQPLVCAALFDYLMDNDPRVTQNLKL